MGSVLRFAIRGKAICDDQIQAGEVPEGIAKSFTRGVLVCIWSTPASGELVTGNHQQAILGNASFVPPPVSLRCENLD